MDRFILKPLKLLFPVSAEEPFFSIATLLLRLGLAGAMLTHGLAKLSNFQTLWTTFPDPIGLGSGVSVTLAVFAEVFCSLAIVAGLLTRLSVIPLMTTMCVAFFVVHASDPFAKKELALLYLIGYVVLFLLGPGKASLDGLVARRLFADKPKEN